MLALTDKWLMRLAGAILFVVGAVKIISAFSGVRYLDEFDPVLPFLKNKIVLVLAGNLELFVAGLILGRPDTWQARYGLLTLWMTLGIYRAGLWAMAVPAPCPCLGRATDWLHLSPPQANVIAVSLFVVLGLVAAFATGFRWLNQMTRPKEI